MSLFDLSTVPLELPRECQTTIDARLVAMGIAVEGYACPVCQYDRRLTDRSQRPYSVAYLDEIGSVLTFDCCFDICHGTIVPNEKICGECAECPECCECSTCAYDGEKIGKNNETCGQCDNCDHHCECRFCSHCSAYIEDDDDCCDRCDRCDACCVHTTCYGCLERVSDTTTVDGEEYCGSCLEDFSYCDECSEYYNNDNSEEHDHMGSGCCEAPHLQFKFPNDGHGNISQDERITVELPQGTIDEEGIRLIQDLVYQALRDNPIYRRRTLDIYGTIEEVGPTWQTARGNFTKRLASALYKSGVKLDSTTISAVGNLATDHSTKTATWFVEFTRDLNRDPAYFYNSGSCWFDTNSSYGRSRCALKNWGGLAIRCFSSMSSNNKYPTGRAWVQPVTSALQPTHDAIGAHAYVVYNSYGDFEGYPVARIVAHLTGRTYKRVQLLAHPQYINSGNAYLVADETTCSKKDSIRFAEHDYHDTLDAKTLRRAA